MRVLAVMQANQEEIIIFGRGEYVGNCAPYVDTPEFTNPKIVLDSGEVVWGFECWWGPEEKFLERYPKATIREVSIDALREGKK